MRKRDFFHTGLNVSRSDLENLPFTMYGANPTGAQDYFVDGNVRISEDGLHWDRLPTKSLSEAITLSNASIGLATNRWWARRNRIFVCGDTEIDEDLTVLPEKCDIIGVGYDILPYPRIYGNHVIAAATKGVRFFNCGFVTQTTADLLVLPTGCHGFGMHGCFLHAGVTSALKCIEITASAHCRFTNNRIIVGGGDRTYIFSCGISVEGTTSHDMLIAENQIDASLGIDIVEAGGNNHGGMICDNYIRAATVCIEDSSNDFPTINNRLISDADQDSDIKGAIIVNEDLAVNNIVTHSGAEMSERYPFIKVTA